MLVRFLVLELLFQALSRYSKILVYTCISTIFCSRTVILQLLVVQVVSFLLQFLCLRCIARSAYVENEVIRDIRHTGHFSRELARQFVYGQTVFPQRKSQILIPNSSRLNRLVIFEAQFLYPFEGG